MMFYVFQHDHRFHHRRLTASFLIACCLLLLLLTLPSASSQSAACIRLLPPHCASGAPCGDLIIDGARVQRSAYVVREEVRSDSCAVQEGCTRAGTRDLLRFDMATPNIGNRPVLVGNAGAPSMAPCFTWSPCHNHYHFPGYAEYILSRNGRDVARGAKASSCLQDALRWPGSPASTVIPASQLYTCAIQGIHAGYQDLYGSHLDCQWIDVTGLAAGTYQLTVRVNPNRVLAESNYNNNEITVPVVIPANPRRPSQNPYVCATHGGCQSCTTSTSCGWCSSGGYCSSGSYLGPSTGSCSEWNWSNAQCGTCESKTSCGLCVATSGCGWCPSRNICTRGTVNGPTSGSCPSGTWQFGASSACGRCTSYSTCATCTKGTGCGWCSNTNRCWSGNWLGPTETGSTCASNRWTWSIAQCGTTTTPPTTTPTTPAATCARQTTCSTCAATAGCGWCPSKNTCVPGSSSGPTTGGSCPSWQFGSSNTCGNCAAQTSCGTCTKATGCGWCRATSRCAAGTWLGPSGATCATWTWSHNQCPATTSRRAARVATNTTQDVEEEETETEDEDESAGEDESDDTSAATAIPCIDHPDCASCARSSGCGWCSSTGSCVSGGWLGPKNGTCTPWVWSSGTCTVANSIDASGETTLVHASTPPSAEAACERQQDCNSCAMSRGCGWCPESVNCRYGGWTGPRVGTCSNWVWSPATCMNDGIVRKANPSIRMIIRSAIGIGNVSNSVDPTSISDIDSECPAVDPSRDLKRFDLSIDDILKTDDEGNLFKYDPIGTSLKDDPSSEGLKQIDTNDVDLRSAARPSTTPRISTRTSTNTSSSTSDNDFDMYDPEPNNPEMPHGHVETHVHMVDEPTVDQPISVGSEDSHATQQHAPNNVATVMIGNSRGTTTPSLTVCVT